MAAQLSAGSVLAVEDTSGPSSHGTPAVQAQRLVPVSPVDWAKPGPKDQR